MVMRYILLLLILLPGWWAPARAGSVAITMDDLPIFGRIAPPAEADAITTGLLDGFRRHHWPVTGFVNEIQLEGPNRTERTGLLARWLDAAWTSATTATRISR